MTHPEAARVAIIDYGMGNVGSVARIVSRTGAKVTITDKAVDIADATHLILPGVGAFPDAMKALNARQLIAPMEAAVLRNGKPILGICLGMELLARSSSEVEPTQGLGWVDAEMVPFPKSKTLKVPHIGWNQIRHKRRETLMEAMDDGDFFYFVHSYHMVCNNADDVVAVSEYGGEFVAVVQRNNVMGTQFHPEKSQANGFRLLLNFLMHHG